MKPIEIKIRMMRAGVSARMIAEKIDVTTPFILQVVAGLRHTQYVREAIAEAIGRPVEKIWPPEPRPAPRRVQGLGSGARQGLNQNNKRKAA